MALGGLDGLRRLGNRLRGLLARATAVARGRRARKEALRRQEQSLALILDALELDTLEWDVEVGSIALGSRLERFLGRRVVEGGLDGLLAHVHPDDRAAVRQAAQAHFDGLALFLEVEARAVAGTEERWLLARGRAVERDRAGRPRRVLGVIRDVTEQRLLRRRLEASEQLATLGRLVAAIAHELNGPLAVVFANLDFAEEALKRESPQAPQADPAEVRAALAEARLAQRRVAGLLRQLGAFAVAGERRREPVSIQKEIGVAVSLAEVDLGARLVMEAHFGEVPDVRAAPGELAQVAAHVLVHVARAGAPDPGGEAPVSVSTRVDEAGRAVVEVQGRGRGGDAAASAFDWFLRHERSDLSAGLGLAIGRAVIAALGGEIQVSEGGGAVTVRMLLPPAPPSD